MDSSLQETTPFTKSPEQLSGNQDASNQLGPHQSSDFPYIWEFNPSNPLVYVCTQSRKVKTMKEITPSSPFWGKSVIKSMLNNWQTKLGPRGGNEPREKCLHTVSAETLEQMLRVMDTVAATRYNLFPGWEAEHTVSTFPKIEVQKQQLLEPHHSWILVATT